MRASYHGSTATAAAVLSILTPSMLSSVAAATTCSTGVHIIAARASLEPPGFGMLGALVDILVSTIPDSSAVAVDYPASIFEPTPYYQSEPVGVTDATSLILDYTNNCPGSNHKIVLLGYSQGAQVVGDTLLGSSYSPAVFPTTPSQLSQKLIDNHILAVILMGDPSNVANTPILYGGSTHNGTFARNNSDQWAARNLVSKTISYCDPQDTFCDNGVLGLISIGVHAGYVVEYAPQSLNFVNDRWKAANLSSSPDDDSDNTPTKTGTGSASSPTVSNSGVKIGSALGGGPATMITTVMVLAATVMCL